MSRTPTMTLLAALIASTTLSPYLAVAQDAAPETKGDANPAVIPKKPKAPSAPSDAQGGKVENKSQTEMKSSPAETNSTTRVEGKSGTGETKPPVDAQAPAPEKDAKQQNAKGTEGKKPSSSDNATTSGSQDMNESGTSASSSKSATTKGTDTNGASKMESTGTAGSKNGQAAATTTETEKKAGSQVNINVTTEQRTEIRNVIVENKVEVVKPTFTVTVGTAVPRTVKLHRLPSRVIQIVPQYRNYEYIVLSDERIIIIDPASYEIVYVLTL